jgi:hypothetical protein
MIWLQVLAVFSLPGVSALQEFVQRGKGTPLPYDPPRQLVTTGPYAYIRNPMQLAAVLLFLGMAVLFHSYALAGAAIVSFAYSAGLARWNEETELAERWGSDWTKYRNHLPSWKPRWRPFRLTAARLYVAGDCELCQSVGQWFSKRHPVHLEIVPAATYVGPPLRRITYVDGIHEEQGMAAIARALEHINLAWAMVGFFIRLPGVLQFTQLISDVAIAAPREQFQTPPQVGERDS